MKPDRFLKIMGIQPQKPDGPAFAFQIGAVNAGYAAGRPRILFDGEAVASTRTYPKAKGLVLVAGDRVLLAMVGQGGGGVVVCVIE